MLVKVKTYKYSTNFFQIFNNCSDIYCYDCNGFLRSANVLHYCRIYKNIKIDKCICIPNKICISCKNLNKPIEFWYPPPQYS